MHLETTIQHLNSCEPFKYQTCLVFEPPTLVYYLRTFLRTVVNIGTPDPDLYEGGRGALGGARSGGKGFEDHNEGTLSQPGVIINCVLGCFKNTVMIGNMDHKIRTIRRPDAQICPVFEWS